MFHFYKKWTYMKYIDHVCRKIPKGAIQEELLREACMIFCLLSSTRKSENAIRGCKETGYQKNSESRTIFAIVWSLYRQYEKLWALSLKWKNGIMPINCAVPMWT
uniref:Uncharacterized protein n=1 Tax=Rhizophagus irregularis (strain DAOM 181602 / DAOM 197198 / MUCL 43194) TaxID=747089 RepID=U9T4P1_RHIID